MLSRSWRSWHCADPVITRTTVVGPGPKINFADSLQLSERGTNVAAMTSILNPYLNFDGTAREALEFYREVFGGELSMNTFGEFGHAEEPFADKIMHGNLKTDQGYTLMCSDLPPGMEHQPGTNITVSISGDESEPLRGFFEKLADGGSIQVPLAKQPWGDKFGQCTDRFGIQWMVDIYDPAG